MSAQSQAPEEVVCGDRTVGDGECIYSIAADEGHKWENVWDAPENADLKAARRNPGALLPGDALTLPDKRPKQAEVSTGQSHTFKFGKSTTIEFRLLGRMPDAGEDEPDDHADHGQCGDHDGDGGTQAQKEDDGRNEAMADTPCKLEYEGGSADGTTDGDGVVKFKIPVGIKEGTLKVGEGEQAWEMKVTIGGLNPVESISGVQQRLSNLGYLRNKVSGEFDEFTRAALRHFQTDNSLDISGKVDDATRDKLNSAHGG